MAIKFWTIFSLFWRKKINAKLRSPFLNCEILDPRFVLFISIWTVPLIGVLKLWMRHDAAAEMVWMSTTIGIDHSEFWFFINGVSFCELAHNIYCLNRLHSKFFRLCWGFSWDKNLITILCPFCICILYSVFRIKCLSWSLESSWSWTS